MAPDHTAKRTKITDTRSSSNSDSDTSVVVASSSGIVESTPSVATTTAVNIKDILVSLSYDTTTEAEVIKNMGSLKTSENEIRQELFELQGVSIILSVIHRFKKSAKLVELGLWALFCITYNDQREFSKVLIRWDFHDTIPSLANMHTDSKDVQTNAAFLFKQLAISLNPQLKNKLATEEIIQFMRNLMITFPDNEYIVSSACEYFNKMSQIPELKYRLLKNKVALPLVAAYEKFCKWKDDDNDSDEDDDGLGEEIAHNSNIAVFNLFS